MLYFYVCIIYLSNTNGSCLNEIYFIAAEKQQGNKVKSTTNQNGNEQQQNSKPEPTWIHDIFQGTLTNETRCLNCETVSNSVSL